MLATALLAIAFAAPTAAELVHKYDEMMSPATFDAAMEMTAHRDDGSARGYKMTILKGTDDKIRLRFDEPASARGQEMLRVGDNMWVYLPSLKRAVRLANRDSFQGGDFNNSDVLRVNYEADYTGALAASDDPALTLVELKSKTAAAGYDKIRLYFDKDGMPVRAEYYAASGKMLRSAQFSDVKDFHGHRRPAHIVMRNELATKRFSELTTSDMNLDAKVPASKFVLDDLGR